MTTLKKKIEFHNCVDILIFNNQGELYLQMRSRNDKSFPSHWDFSAGGHIKTGESNETAAKREVLEELGVSAPITLISKEHFQYPAWKPSVLRDVNASIYKMIHNGPFKIEQKEVAKIDFFSLDVIQKMIDTKAKFHPEFLLAWKKGIIKL